MRWLPKFVLAVVVALAAWWAWRTFFPSDEERVQRLLNTIAETVSVPSEGKFVGGVLAADRLKGFFTPEIEINVDAPGEGRFAMSGREELAQAYLAARSQYRGLKVEFVGAEIRLAPDHQSAVANLTARVTQAGNRESSLQELKINLVHGDDDWRVSRVETVRAIR